MEQQHHLIGIDIGKKSIHVCHPVVGQAARKWPVTVLTFKTDLDWHNRLVNLIAPRAVVCFEPTGYHLSAPILNVIRTFRPDAEIWLIGHSVSGQIRQSEVSAAKTDEMDARALTVAAHRIAHDQPPRNIRRYDPGLDEEVQALRSLVNNHRRITKTTTRLTNRLHAYVHSIHPLLDIKYTTWLGWATSHNLIDPHDIHEFLSNPPKGLDGRRTRHLKSLAQYLPDITASQTTRGEIERTVAELNPAEKQRATLEEEITAMIHQPPFETVTRRIATIPAKSMTDIAALHVAGQGIIDQLDADQFKAMIGIAARSNTSGSIDRTRAQKSGYSPAKDALYMWTARLLNEKHYPGNPVLKYHQRLKARPDKDKEFRATRAKLAQIISGVARSPEGYKS